MILSNNIPWSLKLTFVERHNMYNIFRFLTLNGEGGQTVNARSTFAFDKKNIFSYLLIHRYMPVTAGKMWPGEFCVSVCVSSSWFQRGTLKLLDPFKVWVKAHDFGWPTKITNVYAKLKTNYYWETHLVLDFWHPNENEGFQCEKKTWAKVVD